MEHHVCPWWLGWLHSIPLRKLIQNPNKILSPYIEPGYTVLDVGCGPGFFSIPMAKMVGDGGKVVAVDLQAKMLNYARRRAARARVTSRIEFHQCEAESLGIKGAFDFVSAFYLVHEVPDQQKLFNELVEKKFKRLRVDEKQPELEEAQPVVVQDTEKLLRIAQGKKNTGVLPRLSCRL